MVGAYEDIQYMYMSHVHVHVNFEIKFAENIKKIALFLGCNHEYISGTYLT